MRLVPAFILETHNQTNNKCVPKLVQTDNASSGIKTANEIKQCDKPDELLLTATELLPLVIEKMELGDTFVVDDTCIEENLLQGIVPFDPTTLKNNKT